MDRKINQNIQKELIAGGYPPKMAGLGALLLSVTKEGLDNINEALALNSEQLEKIKAISAKFNATGLQEELERIYCINSEIGQDMAYFCAYTGASMSDAWGEPHWYLNDE